jgi:hypothetical protein
MKTKGSKILVSIIVFVLIVAGISSIYYYIESGKKEETEEAYCPYSSDESINFSCDFSEPSIVDNGIYVNVYVDEADFNDIHDGWPVIPVKTFTYELPFGTKILNVSYQHSKSKNYKDFVKIKKH